MNTSTITFFSVLAIMLNLSKESTFTCFAWFVIGFAASSYTLGHGAFHVIKFIDDHNFWPYVQIYLKACGILKRTEILLPSIDLIEGEARQENISNIFTGLRDFFARNRPQVPVDVAREYYVPPSARQVPVTVEPEKDKAPILTEEKPKVIPASP